MAQPREDVYWECPVQADDDSKDVLRVVACDGGVPQLEKRHFFRNRHGAWEPGRQRGLTRLDVELVLARINEISKAFRRDSQR